MQFFDFLCYTFSMTKADIRQEIKSRISKLSLKEIKEQSEKLCESIIESADFAHCTTLLAYMALPDEADLGPVIQKALSKGKKVFLPHVFPGTNKMEFYRYNSDSSIEKGDFGISEPPVDETQSFTKFLERLTIQQYSPAPHSSNYVEIEEQDPKQERIIVLIPGRAFTKSGKRIGRGKGFYDIYLSSLPQIFYIKKTGVCLACQIMADLPVTPDDILMDDVISEE